MTDNGIERIAWFVAVSLDCADPAAWLSSTSGCSPDTSRTRGGGFCSTRPVIPSASRPSCRRAFLPETPLCPRVYQGQAGRLPSYRFT